MRSLSQVFDDARVLADARRRVRGVVVLYALLSGAVVALAPVAAFSGQIPSAWVAGAAGLALTLGAVVVMARLTRQHGRLWRVKVSAQRVLAHDAGGRRHSLDWTAVSQVDVSDRGVEIVGRDGRQRARLAVPTTMPHVDRLARLAVRYARSHGATVCVDGCPVSLLDLGPLTEALNGRPGVGA